MGEYLALPDGAGGFTQDFTGPALLRIPTGTRSLRLRGSHPLRPAFPGRSTRSLVRYVGPTTPLWHAITVWARPRSLATTCGITVLFSSPPPT